MKATNDEIIKAYKEEGTIWKAGERLGMCGQSVHERLQKLGVELKNKKFNENEKIELMELYNNGFECGDGKLKALSHKLKRTVPFLSRMARKEGLSHDDLK